MKTRYQLLSVIILLTTLLFFISDNNKIVDEDLEHGPDTRPNEWAWMQRTYPYFDESPTARVEAIEAAKQLRAESKRLNKVNEDMVWEFAGPTNVGGRIVDIEFNPIEPNIVYAGAATGGVFKSTDTGLNWSPIFDEQLNLSVGDIGIDPQNPDVIYVGTGEANGGHNNFPGAGMFKSNDAGETWSHIGLDNTASIGRIIVHPSNSNVVYAAAVGSYFKPNPERGVYKSIDGGDTWENEGKPILFVSDSTGAIDLVMHPTNPNILFAAMWERVRGARTSHLNGPTSGVYRTLDGGATWTELGEANGLPNSATTTIGRIGLAISQSDPDILFALYNDGSNYIGLYKTDDLGDTWEKLDPSNTIRNGGGGFSWYFGQIRVKPNDPETVYVLDVEYMHSTNGGTSWQRDRPTNTHVDHHALAFHPNNPDYLILGNDGGINISTDGGTTWKPPVQLPITQFYEIGLDATNPERLYGGTQDNGTNRTKTGSLSDWDHIYGGDGFYVIVDPTNPDIIYAESQFGALGKWTASDGWDGATSGIGSEGSNWSTPVVMDPNDPRTLYYGTNKIYRTTTGAVSDTVGVNAWKAISDKLTTDPASSMLGTVTTIAVAPTNSNYIIAGTDDSNVWGTFDGHDNWVKLSASLPDRWVTRVIFDPKNENIFYVTFSGLKWREPQPHVFRTSDRGVTWTDISNNLPDAPVNAIAIDNINSNIIYIGNDVGVFYTTDTGETWQALGTGIPIVPINDMKIHPTSNYLVAGTHARGMYTLDISILTGIEKSTELPSELSLYQNYPNPFNPSSKIKYQIPSGVEGSLVKLQVFDALGREVKTLVNERQSSGTYEVEFNGKNLASGIYFYSLSVGSSNEIKKMVLMK